MVTERELAAGGPPRRRWVLQQLHPAPRYWRCPGCWMVCRRHDYWRQHQQQVCPPVPPRRRRQMPPPTPAVPGSQQVWTRVVPGFLAWTRAAPGWVPVPLPWCPLVPVLHCGTALRHCSAVAVRVCVRVRVRAPDHRQGGQRSAPAVGIARSQAAVTPAPWPRHHQPCPWYTCEVVTTPGLWVRHLQPAHPPSSQHPTACLHLDSSTCCAGCSLNGCEKLTVSGKG